MRAKYNIFVDSTRKLKIKTFPLFKIHELCALLSLQMPSDLSLFSFQPLKTSSLINFDESDGATSCSDDILDEHFETLYHGSGVSVRGFCDQMSAMQTKHRLSDAAMKDILSVFSTVLPLPNKCPTFHHLKKETVPEDEPLKLTLSNGVCFLLPFAEIMENIVRRHPDIVNIQGREITGDRWTDIIGSSALPIPESNTIYFALNTDGLSPINSKNIHVWPIILSVINLEPKFRRESSNLVMMSLFVGSSKPDWAEILPFINAQLHSGLDIDGKHFKCKVVCLVADMPAKSSVCNFQSHNAK